ncbi:unnamed protein product [Protopolystoma xenopodis]|uniref:Uncharacterized protein n=1 Tax=Protopolystoma xenopodis TaxID=117903 RepID=A0A448XBB3_9PLAT|nr:unnamed protein product [Protopolystoma xenopodis]
MGWHDFAVVWILRRQLEGLSLEHQELKLSGCRFRANVFPWQEAVPIHKCSEAKIDLQNNKGSIYFSRPAVGLDKNGFQFQWYWNLAGPFLLNSSFGTHSSKDKTACNMRPIGMQAAEPAADEKERQNENGESYQKGTVDQIRRGTMGSHREARSENSQILQNRG